MIKAWVVTLGAVEGSDLEDRLFTTDSASAQLYCDNWNWGEEPGRNWRVEEVTVRDTAEEADLQRRLAGRTVSCNFCNEAAR